MQKPIAIIPARAGSKRIPGKNIVEFHGKPMIAWTIEAANESKLFEYVIVSTDSDEIADISRRHGANVPFLRDSKSDDHSPVSEATLRTLIQLEELGEYFDEVVQLFAACPLRDADDILNCYKFFKDKNVPFVLSAYKFLLMNPWWAFSLDSDGNAEWIIEGARKSRSQDLASLYGPSGAIWIGKVEKLKAERTFYGKGHVFWQLNWKHAIDIDTTEDLELARVLYQSV
ncbi:cytidylyltransferase domain-containing protein [Acidobacteriota bacterium]